MLCWTTLYVNVRPSEDCISSYKKKQKLQLTRKQFIFPSATFCIEAAFREDLYINIYKRYLSRYDVTLQQRLGSNAWNKSEAKLPQILGRSDATAM